MAGHDRVGECGIGDDRAVEDRGASLLSPNDPSVSSSPTPCCNGTGWKAIPTRRRRKFVAVKCECGKADS